MSTVASESTGTPGVFLGTGRRKTSVARVRLRAGNGKISINGRELENFFHVVQHRNDVVAPLVATGKRESVDVRILVDGGGITGQSGACKLGIARALRKFDPETYEALKNGGLLTRDSRMIERKKYGLHKARKATQFSKR
jgi:small subunit ribosomal protein S9